jgi:hypothetical protein
VRTKTSMLPLRHADGFIVILHKHKSDFFFGNGSALCFVWGHHVVCLEVGPWFPQLLSDTGKNPYKGFAHNSAERFRVSWKSAQGRPHFACEGQQRFSYAYDVKPGDVQDDLGGRVNILGGYIIGHCEEKRTYEHVFNSEWLPRYSGMNLQIQKHCERW